MTSAYWRPGEYVLPTVHLLVEGIEMRVGPDARPRPTDMACGEYEAPSAYSSQREHVSCKGCLAKMGPMPSVPLSKSGAEQSDAKWLVDHGEDIASMRALAEAVDAAAVAQWGEKSLPLDSRAKTVNRLSADLTQAETARGELEVRIAELEDGANAGSGGAAGPEAEEDVPLGGLSREDTAYVLSSIDAARQMLKLARAWPDDARKVELFLENLLRGSWSTP